MVFQTLGFTQKKDSLTPLHLFEKLKNVVFERRPGFQRIMEKYGGKSIAGYADHFLEIKTNDVLEKRRAVCRKVIKEGLKKRLPEDVVENVDKQLEIKPLVSTSDHHAICDHPSWINADIITALPYRNDPGLHLPYSLVLSFASVSQNNSFGYPRGIMFHGGESGEGELIRIPLLPDRIKMRTVYGSDPYTKKDLEKAKSLLLEKRKDGLISQKRAEEVALFINAELDTEDILSSPGFTTQITKINFHLWPKLFGNGPEKPHDLIYLDAETVVRDLLRSVIFSSPDSLLFRAIFDEKVRALILQYFDAIPGAFSTERDSGTYMFWGRNEKGYRLRMLPKRNTLVAEDDSFSIPLDVPSVTAALTAKTIFPSAMLVYMTLSLYFGLKCLGGYCQVNNLARMRDVLQNILIDLGEEEEAQNLNKIQAKEFCGMGIVLAYLENSRGELTPATGIDLYLKKDKLSFKDYKNIASELTVREMMDPIFPEMYKDFVPVSERDPELLTLSYEDIFQMTGLEQRLKNVFQEIIHES
ncbi:hypothetical protein HZA38_01625 [Candidatus Peregrinibacteria bacterium]|nr:hypothetical protein [Candidatus Peregrinibacteria bacterium]